jgi:hypothetical protein
MAYLDSKKIEMLTKKICRSVDGGPGERQRKTIISFYWSMKIEHKKYRGSAVSFFFRKEISVEVRDS